MHAQSPDLTAAKAIYLHVEPARVSHPALRVFPASILDSASPEVEFPIERALELDAKGRVSGALPASPKASTQEQKDRFKARVQKGKAALQPAPRSILSLCEAGVVRRGVQ